LLANIFFPWGIAHGTAPATLGTGLAFAVLKIGLLGIALALSETVLAKMRLFRVPAFLNLALLLALLGVLIHVILEVGT
jgi:formate hydrogenlyase subunit 4